MEIFKKLDKLLSRYFGLVDEIITPHFIKMKNDELVVLSTNSFKRHLHQTSVSNLDLQLIAKDNQKKLGIAVGKAIASNLVVSFEESLIKR